jgi:hypothetical protein
MKKIILVGLLMFGFTHIHVLQAGDDVYDAPTPKKVKVQVQRQAPVQEQSVPYYEDNNGRQQRNSPISNKATTIRTKIMIIKVTIISMIIII